MLTTDAVTMFLNSRKAKGLSPLTIRWYSGILSKLERMFPDLPSSADQLEVFLASCNAGDERKHGYFRALRAFYRFLQRRADIPSPVVKLDAPKRIKKIPHSLTPDELDQLLSFPHAPKIKAALLFLADSGCRIGELANLTPADLSVTPWGFVAKVTGKTGSRLVPIGRDVYQIVHKVLPLGYSKDTLERSIREAFKDARVRGTAHTLRHTFASLWEGQEELVLQQIMGHSNLSTTRIYRQLRVKKLCQSHNRFTPLKTIPHRRRAVL